MTDTPYSDGQLEEILTSIIDGTDAQMTEIGWERWSENRDEAKQRLSRLLIDAKIAELDNFEDDPNGQGYYLKVNGGNVNDRGAELEQQRKELE